MMSSATYPSTIFSKEKKGNCEYDAVHMFMVHIHAIQLREFKEAEDILSTRVYPQWIYSTEHLLR